MEPGVPGAECEAHGNRPGGLKPAAAPRTGAVLATINREEILDAERGKELDNLVEEAR